MAEAKRISVGDLEFHYHIAGSGPRPFVLVHGFTGSSDDFVDALPRLAERGRTVALDNRGHGDSSNPGRGYTLEQMALDLDGFLDAIGVDSCDLLGHSLGGMVALRFTLAHPERVHSLVLMDTTSRAIDGASTHMFEMGAKLMREHGGAAMVAAMRAGLASGERQSAMARSAERMGEDVYWRRIERKLISMDPEAFLSLAREMAEQEPVDARLGEIRCPTTVLVGVGDEPFVQPSKDMAAAIPDAELAIIPDAQHSPQFENEAAWFKAIEAHLDRARG
jgi:2-succinyl-6-hydroxy-2,4-cyclohexadiene-1-carboxylate synthase